MSNGHLFSRFISSYTKPSNYYTILKNEKYKKGMMRFFKKRTL
ncbi:hypothetical protein EMIT079MI2_10195 [Bacillus sp. IT-79MI2]|nr:hypothetical protein BTH41_00461 [Bacillus mycoides]